MSRKSSSVSLWLMIVSFALALSLPAQTFSPWSHTTNGGAEVNSTARESCQFVTNSGRTLYFASNRAGGAGGLDIYVAHRADVRSAWGTPQNIPTVNSADMDHLAWITPDGHSMIFASSRGNAADSNDIYMSFRRNAEDDLGWEAPIAISEINSTSDDFGPWGYIDPSNGRLVLYLVSKRPGGPGGYDIYSTALQADGKFSTLELVTELSTVDNDSMPAITADGREMYLASNRPGGFGSYDIWKSTRGSVSEPWSQPVNLGADVNTSAVEQRGVTWGDGTELYFFSGRSGGVGDVDLYRSTRTKTTLIPVVASTRGADANFVTSGTLSNPGDSEITGKLVFHPAGIEALSSDPSRSYRLAPYESQMLPDVMGSIGVTGVGSLEIVPDPGAAPATTFVIHKGATAFVVPAATPESVMTIGQHSAVKMPADMTHNRVNVGVRTFESGAAIWVCMHEPDGTYIRGFTREFPPNYLAQMPVAELLGGAVMSNQMVMFTIEGGSALVFVSTIENGGPGSTMEIVRPVAD